MKNTIKLPAQANAVKIGRDYFKVANLAEAVQCWEAARDQNFWGASDAPLCTACVDKKLYRISYNGRVWDAATRVEVRAEPQAPIALLN